MKLSLSSPLAVLVSIIFTQFPAYNLVSAATFDQQEVDQSSFIAIARPYGNNKYDLLIIRQIPQQRQCWSESGTKPVTVDPLLLNFDFTGSCERSTDSNGYSVRIDGEDYGLNYLLSIEQRNGELVLVALNRVDPSKPPIVIGRTYGMTQGLLKIFLNPGWRFTKRTYQGKVLGHVYLTGDTQAMVPEDSSAVSSSNQSDTAAPSSQQNGNTSPTVSQQSPDEYTFTAESSEPPAASSNNSFSNDSSLESYRSERTPSVPAANSNTRANVPNTKKYSGELPPPPFSPSSLPPVAPPSQNPNNQIVPPPSLNSSNSQRQNLSDTLNNLNNNSGRTPSSRSIAQAKNYKVLVEAKTGSQQQQLRSLYPESFPTKYNGQSFWQVGVFSTADNAQNVIQNLKNAGLNSRMIPF
ncbi:DUF3747 domain-containing protein [Gloeothece verrucosa]|uniref:Sporulation domain protein n=1 Tax=Gloeothece verrucosa (strain PCC 7822) TaxID=497965 RepID=E0UDD6_GLOV7|nr:DUF3747 domain-containing protein [Gloeothece verrucosa]ADN14127.1 sporulation domain protein [Gloeothece verrucosa PCC 7822]